METSTYIASLLGPAFTILALTILANRESFERFITEFTNSYALIILAGLATMIAGLAIIKAHNVWVWDWPVIITIFGWLAVVGGALRMLAPQLVVEMAQAMAYKKLPLTISAIVILPLGIFLSLMGFGVIS